MPTIEPHNPLGMTFGDMLANAAVETGDANYVHGKAVLPADDPEARHNATTVVMRAVRRVVAGYQWSWMEQSIAVTIDSDDTPITLAGEPWRYRMPWSMAANGVRHVGYRDQFYRIQHVSPDMILDLRQSCPDATGMPTHVSFRAAPRGTASGYTGCEMIVFPEPNAEAVIEIRYRAYPEGMSDLSDTFIAGPEFNMVLDAAIRYEAKFSIGDPRAESFKAELMEAMELARETDRRSRPAHSGVMSYTMQPPGMWDDEVPLRQPSSIEVNGIVI